MVDKGYFHPPERTQATRNTIRTIFTKTGWSSREVKAVRGIIRALAEPGAQALTMTQLCERVFRQPIRAYC